MKNLAGILECDVTIKEELTLAGIDQLYVGHVRGEVPYTIEGAFGKWHFERLWYYWSASVIDPKDGVPMKDALKFNNKKHPSEPNLKMGNVVRVGGYAGGISPKEFGSKKDADGNRYITHYHIDDQVGLNAFVKLIDTKVILKRSDYNDMIQKIDELEKKVSDLRWKNNRLLNSLEFND